MNLISISIGAILLLIGIACIALITVSVEYIDANGILHENFFLLPAAFLFLLSGFTVFFVTGAKNIVLVCRGKNDDGNRNQITYIGISLGVVLFCIGGFFILLETNSGMNTAIPAIIMILSGITCFTWVIVKRTIRKGKV